MVFSVVAALAVFVSMMSYVSSVNSKIGDTITVYRAKKDIPAYQPLSAENLETFDVPRRWAASNTQVSASDLNGRRISFNVSQGTVIGTDMLVPESDLSPTEREIAVNVNAVTGLVGRVRTGDHVDIYTVFSDVPGLPKQVRVLVRDVRIVSIGGEKEVSRGEGRTATTQQVLPVTLALEPDDALAVTYASSFASEVRLVGLPAGATQNRSDEKDEYDATNLGGEAVVEGAR
jgi:pilus assembly protein CpaB